jgi:hypothetical protein
MFDDTSAKRALCAHVLSAWPHLAMVAPLLLALNLWLEGGGPFTAPPPPAAAIARTGR